MIEKTIVENLSSFVNTSRNSGILRSSVGNCKVVPLGGDGRSSTDKQNTGRAYVSETASPTTLGAIVQSVFVSYISCVGNEKIRIADGSLASKARKGQISHFNGFSLHNVLHVSRISYNLLSISKITRELNCKATFLPDSVSFQDLSWGKMIGMLSVTIVTSRHDCAALA
ncbi:reverse transcriptase [Cucumis melo var. makuwa]|uniref:Reverse transcriptase n=1 Tax=Cucumis melo var. makuwa TaxID=1194695 RepID=A0A5D3CUF7_CUCMM|nr:reverse transcriptase [Cucumis melo var. makuwa]